MPGDWTEVGRVAAVEPAKRRLRVRLTTKVELDFAARDRVWLDAGDSAAPVLVRILNTVSTPGMLILTLAPGVSRDMVARWMRARVLLPTGEKLPRKESVVGWRPAEWVGMTLTLAESDAPVGTVLDTLPTPAGGVLRVRLHDGRTGWLPATAALIVRMDQESGTLWIHDPEPFLALENE